MTCSVALIIFVAALAELDAERGRAGPTIELAEVKIVLLNATATPSVREVPSDR